MGRENVRRDVRAPDFSTFPFSLLFPVFSPFSPFQSLSLQRKSLCGGESRGGGGAERAKAALSNPAFLINCV